MKLIKFLSVFLLISQSYGQQTISEKAEALVNSNNFHTYKIEKFFLHTNKTVYFSGEKIWFKAYIAEDDTSRPFMETTNLYINLYDADFELVSTHLFYAENGVAHGDIDLPKDLKSSNYYLQADTHWNKNFNRAAIFPIQIVDLANADSVNVNNEIPLQTLDFSSVKLANNPFQFKRTKNLDANSITFILKTESQEIANKKLDNSIAFAVLHREGSLRSVGPVRLKKETKNYKINFAKGNVFNGLNTITLFDKNNQVLTQTNFFYDANPNLDIKIESHTITDDSLTLNLNTLGTSKMVKLSVSVLPIESLMYKNSTNIVSHFLLEPYLKKDDVGIAQRAINGKNLDELTQLKTKVNVFKYKYLSGKPLPYSSEAGLNLNGKVQTKQSDLSNFKLMLSSNENKITEFTSLDTESNFKFNKLLLMHPSKYSLSLLDEKGKTEKASFFVYNTYVNYKANKKLNVTNDFKTLIKQADSINKLNPNNSFANATFPEYEDAESLAEVNLEVYKRKKEFELRQKIKNSGILGLSASRVFKPEDSGFNNGYLLTYLQTLPSTAIRYGSDGTPILINDRGKKSINDPDLRPVAIVYNGMQLSDLSFLQFINAEDIDYIVLNTNGAGYGANYPYGVIHIVTKKGTDDTAKTFKNKDIQENETVFGFKVPKTKYELPELNFTSQNAIDSFSTIDWIPNVDLKPNTDNLLKINRRYHNSFKLIINGITEDGMPIYKEHIIKLESN